MIENISIQETSNGWYVIIKEESSLKPQKYSYSSLDTLRMLEEIGKRLWGKKLVVKENGQ